MEIDNSIPTITLSYINKVKKRRAISSSHEAYEVFIQSIDDNMLDLREEFKIIFLDRRNTFLALLEHSIGTIAGTTVEIKHILASAILLNASSIILGHNHPAKNTKPSRSDIALTEKICAAASYHDIQVLDHVIFSREGFFSFSDEGMLYKADPL